MEVLDLGRRSYHEVWILQRELVEKRAKGEIPDTLILVEHDPIYTAGRAAEASSDAAPTSGQGSEIRVKKLGTVPVANVERGGKLTFHGPGQIVGYPIFLLTNRDLRYYLREVEKILAQVLTDEALLPAKPCPETLMLEPGQLQTGVWIRDRKIASIGIAVKHWVTYHGFAINVSTDPRYFESIEPCGFSAAVMTSLEQELQGVGNMQVLSSNIKRELARKFSELSGRYAIPQISTAEINETDVRAV